jgi:hypothetical protein
MNRSLRRRLVEPRVQITPELLLAFAVPQSHAGDGT